MKDAIWNWFAFWGPVFRDVLSVGLAGLGAYLAYLAIKMGREQEKHSKRQAEIIETQHQFMLEQRAKRPKLAMKLSRPDSDKWDVKTFVITVHNSGDKKVEGFFWHFLIPEDRRDSVRFDWDKPNLQMRHTKDNDGKGYWFYNSYHELPIFPGRPGRVGALIASRALMGEPIHFKWKISSEDGQFPVEGEDDGIIILDPNDPEWT